MSTITYKGHTITRTATTTDTTRRVFGRPVRTVAHIHTIYGPSLVAFPSALIPSVAKAKRMIDEAVDA